MMDFRLSPTIHIKSVTYQSIHDTKRIAKEKNTQFNLTVKMKH